MIPPGMMYAPMFETVSNTLAGTSLTTTDVSR